MWHDYDDCHIISDDKNYYNCFDFRQLPVHVFLVA